MIENFRTRSYRLFNSQSYLSRYGTDRTRPLVDNVMKHVLESQGFHLRTNPRSLYSKDKLFQALATYAPRKDTAVMANMDIGRGVALARRIFARPHGAERLDAQPLTLTTIKRITSNPSGSAGLTMFNSKKVDAMEMALRNAQKILAGTKTPEPCIAFARTQFNGKTRLVWGYPYSMTVVEGLVAHPLIQRFKGSNECLAFGKDTLDVGAKIRSAARTRRFCYSLDFSQFDATISYIVIKQAFRILRSWFDTDQVVPNTDVKVMDVFKRIENYFIHTPIVMPDEKLYLGKNMGVPSGSYFTQLIDSIANVIYIGTISNEFGLGVVPSHLMVLGDDVIFWSNRKVSLNKISKFALDKLNVKVHGEEKSSVYNFGDVVHFLGRDWPNGYPTLDIEGIVDRMYNTEQFRKYSNDPRERKRQAKLLVLSFASTYTGAWNLAHRHIRPFLSNYSLGSAGVDPFVYDQGVRSDGEDINENFVSGLMRYNRKYLQQERHGPVSTPMQILR